MAQRTLENEHLLGTGRSTHKQKGAGRGVDISPSHPSCNTPSGIGSSPFHGNMVPL